LDPTVAVMVGAIPAGMAPMPSLDAPPAPGTILTAIGRFCGCGITPNRALSRAKSYSQ
jgi:hypothetical protein